ncbi:hypothetical protein D9Q98_007606 [Chlorella vulgaris]|uniref:NF-X1-type domain-containing protein n=1 Tax=Chlorella vulgaris TaxID=3077 RepID=A0A9D4YVP0_CHLVU|nr:hypothetical protein D9Q98_007606 [Chlorella vulgaris]
MPPDGDPPCDAESGVFESLFESYAAACGTGDGVDTATDAAYEDGVDRVKEHLLSITGDGAVCMVCLEVLRPTDPVWSCQQGCHAVLHLPCAQSWARRTLAAVEEKAGQRLDPRLFPAAAEEARRTAAWACPKCRQDYRSVPAGYTCWCGKQADPEFNPWQAAHSCGERCDRPAPGCAHPCMLLCHPGPCPPCPRAVSASCYCGALVTNKRCGRQEFSCGGTCGAPLPCGHTCPLVCHDGDCPPCNLASSVACRCGAEAAQLPCSQQGVYQCNRVCGKLLDCGRHRCEVRCHSGACGPCKLAGPKSCPCGKQQLPGAACDVEVPPCGETCGKVLPCSVHTCHERCHTGACTAVCREKVDKSCECGKTTRSVYCQETFRCERRCTQTRSCGRHPCRRRCCVSCPPCEEVCGRWLKCRNHRCPAPCHPGECGPCPLSARISCACGRTHYSVPCGRESTAKPPPCRQMCPVPPLCRHAATQPPHRCHFGPCPPCAVAACGTQLPCNHPCSLTHCHDQPPPAVADYQPPPPPAAPLGPAPAGRIGSSSKQRAEAPPAPAQSAAAEARRLAQVLPRTAAGHLSACPACPVLVPVTCLGGHVTVQSACSTAAPFACQHRCGQPLSCGNHTCQAGCHAVAVQPCAPCTRPCQLPRNACDHACPLACHPPSQACPACTEAVQRPCHCGKTTLQFACYELSAEAAAPLLVHRLQCGKACHRQLPGCPHACQAVCHPGACSSQDCSQEVTVRCSCKRSKRKLPCAEVQRLLSAATGSPTFDGTTPLRLLHCDATCAKAAAAAGAGGDPAMAAATAPARDGGSTSSAAPAVQAIAAATPAAGPAPEKPRRKLTREEKEQEREAARQRRQALERRRQLKQGVMLVLALMVAALLAFAVRFLLLASLHSLDRRAQQAWRPEL